MDVPLASAPAGHGVSYGTAVGEPTNAVPFPRTWDKLIRTLQGQELIRLALSYRGPNQVFMARLNTI